MLTIIFAILGHLATYSGFLGLYLTLVPLGADRPNWHVIAILFLTLIMLGTMFADARRIISGLPTRCATPEAIRAYMAKWLTSGGRIISLSRDLSWVDKQNEKILMAKSRKSEVSLCVEKPTALTKRLEEAGAQIYYYGDLNHIPRSRFTIVDFERDGAGVAVGSSDGKEHVIHEYKAGHHPLYAVAEDLLKVIIRHNKATI